MWKALCVLLIASSAHAGDMINGMPAAKYREVTATLVARDFHRNPSAREHAVQLQMAFNDLHEGRAATRVAYEVTREMIEKEVAQKRAVFQASKDEALRRSLAADIKYLNDSLKAYDIGGGARPQAAQISKHVQ